MNRREFLASAAAAAAPAASAKPLRGVFIILSTPYTDSKAVDYARLAAEVEFLDRAGAHGMVWPQMVSEFTKLTTEERLRGMEVLAKAARGRKPALVLGIQGPDTEAALAYARKAEELAPDAVIATPPARAESEDDARRYYAALAAAVRRPLFVQTTGGA
ncbi:MAG: dihydrodipicolinate synthase family protein, partial [Acidobacteriales bacterium]|nr:dihydrodipicolinate synthase family protein [Terriglobales bacterium]